MPESSRSGASGIDFSEMLRVFDFDFATISAQRTFMRKRVLRSYLIREGKWVRELTDR
jgi:hypothetical protein